MISSYVLLMLLLLLLPCYAMPCCRHAMLCCGEPEAKSQLQFQLEHQHPAVRFCSNGKDSGACGLPADASISSSMRPELRPVPDGSGQIRFSSPSPTNNSRCSEFSIIASSRIVGCKSSQATPLTGSIPTLSSNTFFPIYLLFVRLPFRLHQSINACYHFIPQFSASQAMSLLASSFLFSSCSPSNFSAFPPTCFPPPPSFARLKNAPTNQPIPYRGTCRYSTKSRGVGIIGFLRVGQHVTACAV